MNYENPRIYGKNPYFVVLVHGGPGAPGEMAPVARKLSEKYGVLEPLQTRNSIKGQIEELKQQIIENADLPVILIGWSWGAWLSFILTAENPDLVRKMILVASGPFEAKYAEKIMPTRLSRLKSEEGRRAKELIKILQKGNTNNEILEEFGSFMSKADSFNPIQEKQEKIILDVDIYNSVWKEAHELRRNGKLLEYGKDIKCPVVVIHGDYDSHPFQGVKKPLSKISKDFKLILLKNCGHHPWLEKDAKDEFFDVLEEELVDYNIQGGD